MRLAIISDIHEDIQALSKVLLSIEKMGCDQLVCLGDISGFSVPFYKYQKIRNAPGCLSLLREKDCLILPGNHDFFAARRIPEESAVFDYPSDWYEMGDANRRERADGKIWLHEEHDLDPQYTFEDISYLNSLPEYQVLDVDNYRILLSHYVFPNLSGFQKGFYTSASEFKDHFRFMQSLNCEVSFTGHAHFRGFYRVSEKEFRHYRYQGFRIKSLPLCLGVPPVTRHKRRSGFCLFDTESSRIRAVRCHVN